LSVVTSPPVTRCGKFGDQQMAKGMKPVSPNCRQKLYICIV